MNKIDSKLEAVYNYIELYSKQNGYPPSVRELCSALDISSTSLAHYYLTKLKNEGRIMGASNKSRGFAISDVQKNATDFDVVPYVGSVSAGTGMYADENILGYFAVPKTLLDTDVSTFRKGIGEDAKSFILKISGDSMKEGGILNGDLVVVRKQNYANNGDIVIVYWDNQAVIKRYFRRNNVIVLHPDNSEMFDIILQEQDEPTILGKVTACLRQYDD